MTLVPVDTAKRLALEATGQAEGLPNEVCPNCYNALAGSVSQGLKLRNERDEREKERMIAWKSRVNLIKNARGLMTQKAYSEAAVQYEKYLRVLELVYKTERGGLTPKIFNNSIRSKELTVIASVYWDLLRIYDTSPRYGERMQKSANKLAEFLPFSTILPDIMKRADQFAKSAKNPAVVKGFLKSMNSTRGPCFIATAAFAGEPGAPELLLLRRFRDRHLRPTYAGRQIIWLYYKTSPAVARWIRLTPRRRLWTRYILTKITRRLK